MPSHPRPTVSDRRPWCIVRVGVYGIDAPDVETEPTIGPFPTREAAVRYLDTHGYAHIEDDEPGEFWRSDAAPSVLAEVHQMEAPDA